MMTGYMTESSAMFGNGPVYGGGPAGDIASTGFWHGSTSVFSATVQPANSHARRAVGSQDTERQRASSRDDNDSARQNESKPPRPKMRRNPSTRSYVSSRSRRACSDPAMPSSQSCWAPPSPSGSASAQRSRSPGTSLQEQSCSHGQSPCSPQAAQRGHRPQASRQASLKSWHQVQSLHVHEKHLTSFYMGRAQPTSRMPGIIRNRTALRTSCLRRCR